jgi:hypothetical protein
MGVRAVKILYIGKMKNIVVYLLLLHTKDE